MVGTPVLCFFRMAQDVVIGQGFREWGVSQLGEKPLLSGIYWGFAAR
jgi:hypothetical protein